MSTSPLTSLPTDSPPLGASTHSMLRPSSLKKPSFIARWNGARSVVFMIETLTSAVSSLPLLLLAGSLSSSEPSRPQLVRVVTSVNAVATRGRRERKPRPVTPLGIEPLLVGEGGRSQHVVVPRTPGRHSRECLRRVTISAGVLRYR